jgi:hypothetical protein
LLTVKPAAFEQRAVVFPARVADVDFRIRRETLQEIGADLQRAGAAQGLHGDRTLLLNYRAVGPKYEFLHSLVVRSQAFDRQVGTRRRLFHQHRFRLAHAFQQRHLAVVIVVDAHAQVDLGRVCLH